MIENSPKVTIETTPEEAIKPPKKISKKLILITGFILLILIIIFAQMFLYIEQQNKPVISVDTKISLAKDYIVTPWTADTVSVYDDTYYLFGNIDIVADVFYLEISKEGQEKAEYLLDVTNVAVGIDSPDISRGFSKDKEKTYKKFYFPLRNLSQGTNKFVMKLYTDKTKANLLDEKELLITRIPNTYSTQVSLFDQAKKVNAEEVFKQAGIDFEKEKIWKYLSSEIDPFYSPFNKNIPSNDFFYGKTDNWIDYKLESMGEIGINNSNSPLYRLFYTYEVGGPGVCNNAIYFYIVDGKAYFITNSLINDSNLAPLFLFYMTPSQYIFKDIIAEMDE